tara:strand:+ start:7346 stop:8488 length:1143 start_codon:yes stop_codon:yes gene_type:complete
MRGLLIFYDYFSPAYKAGGPIRSLENLIYLLKDHFSIYLIASNQDHDGEILDVNENEWIPWSDSVSVIYLTKENRGINDVAQIISQINFDCIYINGIFSPFTTIVPLRLGRRLKVPVLIAPRGMLQKGALTIKPFKKKIYLYLLKVLFLRGNHVRWHATDEQEARDISNAMWEKSAVSLVGNIPSFDPSFALSDKPFNSIKFVTISLVAPKKNHVFFLNVLEQLDTDHQIEYDIYGPVTDQDHKDALLEVARKFPSNIKVNFKPAVLPGEVNEVLGSYHYFVLPTFGENFGHAIFEAFNVGLPVLISDQTPWKKLEEKKAGWDLPLDNRIWLSTLNKLLNINHKQYRILQKGARKVAVDYMEQVDLKREYVEMFEEVCSR